MNSRIETLRQISMFEDLSNEALDKIAQIAIERDYRKNMILFMEGEKGEAFYYINKGKVKISKASQDGRELIINILGEGDVFAEVTLFSKNPYPATAEVIEDSQIGIIRNEELEKLISNNADIALQLIKLLNSKLMSAQRKIKNLGLNDTFIRTIQELIKLGQKYGNTVTQGIELDLNLSRQQLAGLVGTSRETISRTLSQLKKEKVINIEGKSIIITNLEKLKEWGSN